MKNEGILKQFERTALLQFIEGFQQKVGLKSKGILSLLLLLPVIVACLVLVWNAAGHGQ